MKKIDGQMLASIAVLNQAGMNLVLVEEDLFIFSEFFPAEGMVPKHRLWGQQLTDEFMVSILSFGTNPDQMKTHLLTKILGLPRVRREYHMNCLWKAYLV